MATSSKFAVSCTHVSICRSKQILMSLVPMYIALDTAWPVQGYTWLKERLQPEETRRQQEKLRDISQLADKLGCTVSQLAIAWCLKNESVQCLLLGAASVEQLYESIQSLQVSWDTKHNKSFHLKFIIEAHITAIESFQHVIFLFYYISFYKSYCRTLHFPVNSAAGQLNFFYCALYIMRFWADYFSLFYGNPI
jgi:Predicted oxidoreductases (related to aryl-alcohol dehydrogenases)